MNDKNLEQLTGKEVDYLIGFYYQFNTLHLIRKIIDLEHIDTLRDMVSGINNDG